MVPNIPEGALGDPQMHGNGLPVVHDGHRCFVGKGGQNTDIGILTHVLLYHIALCSAIKNYCFPAFLMLVFGYFRNIKAVSYDRIKVGASGDFDEGRPETARCHDCNALFGHPRHWGCDAERCPACSGQLISCGCEDVYIERWPIDIFKGDFVQR